MASAGVGVRVRSAVMGTRDETTRFRAAVACEALEPWAVNDVDGHRETLGQLGSEALEIVEEILDNDGDARACMHRLEVLVHDLIADLDGALRVARDAIDLAANLGAGSRREVFERIRSDYPPSRRRD